MKTILFYCKKAKYLRILFYTNSHIPSVNIFIQIGPSESKFGDWKRATAMCSTQHL